MSTCEGRCAVLCLAALAAVAEAGCGNRRDCNAPMAYTTLTMVADAEPTYVTSSNFDADHLQATKDGVDLTREFIGSVAGDGARVYLLEPNGGDGAYTSLVDDMCEWMEQTGWYGCGDSEVSSAQSGGGA